MKLISNILLVLIASLNFQCGKFLAAEDVCFEFDRRECNTDPWAEAIPFSDSDKERIEKMQAYLVTKGVQALEVRAHETMNTSCKACHICPTTKAFLIKVSEKDVPILEELDLLNFKKLDCD